ncbi:MAG: hypothetical protein ACJAT2_002767 [Bacteriovoracaceae bacterium]
MNKYLVLTLFLLQIAGIQRAYGKDRALFRFENQVVFLSEAKKLISELENFRCLKNDWVSLELTNLTRKDYKSFPRLVFSKTGLNKEKQFIERFITLQKLKVFAKEQLVKIDEKELSKVNKTSCFPRGYKSWSNEVEDLVKLEFYIKSRYIDNAKKDEDLKIRLNSFLSTISRKSTDVLFF